MKWAKTGLAALAVAQSVTAYAGPADSDLWIGFENSENGFLLDEDTGQAWMTGTCLKPLAQAARVGDVWTSHTVELVSVGRAMALLDQTFKLDLTPGGEAVRVTSQGRGGEQSFAAIVDRDCASGGQSSGGTCAHLIATQPACQG